jgi:hypothetical protein
MTLPGGIARLAGGHHAKGIAVPTSFLVNFQNFKECGRVPTLFE